jgi:probable F420-dependent oxidoreductase
MNFGFYLPIGGPLAEAGALASLARRGEELGYGFLSTGDHLIAPRQIRSRYPYSDSGEYGNALSFLDQPTLLSFMAAATSRVRLLTGVLVVPYRSPIHTAKVLATVDVLSGGRLTVGCGVGWMREEFEILRVPPFEQRGAATDEYIQVFRELWTSDDPEFHGDYCDFSGVVFEPKPLQKPHPPIWIGGESRPAIRRAATLGDAWFPIGTNPANPLETLQQLSNGLDLLRQYADAAGRDPASVDVAYAVGWPVGEGPDGGERLLTGPMSKVESDMAELEALGVRHLLVSLSGATVRESIERMEAFAEEVFPLASPEHGG